MNSDSKQVVLDVQDSLASVDEGAQPPAICMIPEGLPEDPLTLLDAVSSGGGGQKHLVDIQFDPETNRIYGAGMPALAIAELDGDVLTTLGKLPGHVEHVEVLNETYVALTSRGFSSPNGPNPGKQWLSIYKVSDPSSIKLWNRTLLDGASGMAVAGDYLYLVSHDGLFRTMDVSDVQVADVVAQTDGLGNPWEVVVTGDYAYVADNALGLVVVNISDPLQPKVGEVVSTPGGLQDVDLEGNLLVTAMGSAGVGVFSLSDPTKPELLGSVDTGGAAISVSLEGSFLWSTNQESVSVIDVQDPSKPIVLAVEDTPSWAMHVDAHGNKAYVADWKTISVYEHDPTVLAPDVDPSLSDLYFVPGVESLDVELTNRGGATLDILGLKIDDKRFNLWISDTQLEPGESATLTVSFEDDEEPVESEICISTNDPDEPVKILEVASTNDTGSSVKVGEGAPNFLLPDLDGNLHELSQQIGKPVVLCYFATW